MRETTFQLDPLFTGTAEEWVNGTEQERTEYLRKLMMAAARHITDTVGGEQNIAYIALHLDETNPHMHLGWVPISKDGSLDYRKVLGVLRPDKEGRLRGRYDKQHMRDEHTRLHEMLAGHGYTAIRLNGQRKHQTVEQYKRSQDEKKYHAEQVAALESERQELLDELAGREADADEYFKQAEEFGFQEGFQQGRRSVEREEQRLEEDRERLDAWRSQLEEQNRQIQQQAQAQAQGAQRMMSQAKKLQQQAKMKAKQIVDYAKADALQIKQQAEADATKTRAHALDDVKPLRDQMVNADSEFLDHLLQDPRVCEQREEFVKNIKRGYLFKTPVQRQRDEDRVTLTVAEHNKKYPQQQQQRQQQPQQQRNRQRQQDFDFNF